ncbi:hypothetical protein BDV27DRAFT_127494 [Aspergillus caelatus]|uniref:Uncharacterized protein n=1 Tax=Aspergillus caelatus TaxID=61420 RepID=A0A5N7A5D5_9EURO|nr:uncharacterized protein BDV27DRAFT_127494 [Aspergillus caelatus]KAE8365067.1 hypothetical protein BDV27DRAFT_127494 [Aspergillus caelatus]
MDESLETSDLPEPTFNPAPSPWHDIRAQVFFSFARANWADGLPQGSYGDLEASAPFSDPEKSGKFEGGFSLCMIVRYLESPVGPYDEILWAPGLFQDPRHGESVKRYRITRIYVSSVDSVYNGRRNWNIPKTLANFEFVPSNCPHPPYRQIRVSHPDTPEQPFVSLDFQPIALTSRPLFPISTSYIPMNLEIVMPPIPGSDNWRENGLVGSNNDEWRSVQVDISGKAGMVRVGGELGDGDSFPKLNWNGLWFWLDNAKLSCMNVGE